MDKGKGEIITRNRSKRGGGDGKKNYSTNDNIKKKYIYIGNQIPVCYNK